MIVSCPAAPASAAALTRVAAQICLGPVCVPISAVVPALILLAHRYGWLMWLNPSWFDWRWYRQKYRRWAARRAAERAAAAPQPSVVEMKAE